MSFLVLWVSRVLPALKGFVKAINCIKNLMGVLYWLQSAELFGCYDGFSVWNKPQIASEISTHILQGLGSNATITSPGTFSPESSSGKQNLP